MSPVFPIHLFRVRTLAEVPRSIFSDAPQCEDPLDRDKRRNFLAKLRRGKSQVQPAQMPNQTFHYDFNAAVWMQFVQQPQKPISLALVYRDSRGEYGVIVDEAGVSDSGSAMLSGNVSIESRGPIQSLRACCLGVEGPVSFSVEELYVQRIDGSALTQKRRLA